MSSIGSARRNAREERNNITVDVWESLNGLWLELSAKLRGNRATLDRGALIELVKKQAVMIFGAAQVTLLRDEAYNFLQLGAFLERGDNTARILDVKYHRLLPDGSAARRDASTTSPGRRCWPASARCAPTGASTAARSIP